MRNICGVLLSLVGFWFSSFAGAQAGVTLLVKTDTTCNWKLDGQAMGLLEADSAKVVFVSPGEHLILASAAEGEAWTRTKIVVDRAEKIEKTVDLRLKARNEQISKAQFAETSGQLAGTSAAARSATWTDPNTGLMWTREDNGSDVAWTQADVYCSKLQLANYNDWRLPTLEELDGIHDLKSHGPKMEGQEHSHDVHVRGNLKLTGAEWSSSLGGGPGQPWQWAWLFNFGDVSRTEQAADRPGQTFITFTYSMRALCVRRPKDDDLDR